MNRSRVDDDRIAIVATGPSIDEYTINYVKKNYKKIVVVSDAYKLFPEAIALVSSDQKWWDHHKPKFEGDKFCLTQPYDYPIKKQRIFEGIETTTNSGCFAIKVCRLIYKPKFIHLFGFDLSDKYGAHYFGSHPSPLKNTTPDRFAKFKEQFAMEAAHCEMAKIKVVNLNRYSELNCFPRIYDYF